MAEKGQSGYLTQEDSRHINKVFKEGEVDEENNKNYMLFLSQGKQTVMEEENSEISSYNKT